MNESEQKQWIKANAIYIEDGFGFWESLAEELGFDSEKAEKECLSAEGVTCYTDLSMSRKCDFIDSMQGAHIDHVEEHAPLIFNHIETTLQNNKET